MDQRQAASPAQPAGTKAPLGLTAPPPPPPAIPAAPAPPAFLFCRLLGLTALNSLLQYANLLVWEVCSVN